MPILLSVSKPAAILLKNQEWIEKLSQFKLKGLGDYWIHSWKRRGLASPDPTVHTRCSWLAPHTCLCCFSFHIWTLGYCDQHSRVCCPSGEENRSMADGYFYFLALMGCCWKMGWVWQEMCCGVSGCPAESDSRQWPVIFIGLPCGHPLSSPGLRWLAPVIFSFNSMPRFARGFLGLGWSTRDFLGCEKDQFGWDGFSKVEITLVSCGWRVTLLQNSPALMWELHCDREGSLWRQDVGCDSHWGNLSPSMGKVGLSRLELLFEASWLS